MDETEEERAQLLESIRLQDAALSVAVDNSVVTLDSDSDGNDEDNSGPVSRYHNVEDISDTASSSSDSPSAKKQPSWAEALEANQEYDAVLAQLETEIRQNIVKVNRQLEDVQSKISSETHVGSSVNMKSHWIYVFGIPYFKTANMYPCPNNEDYHQKKRRKEVCWSDLPEFHQWIGRHKNAVCQAVRKLSLEKCEEEARLKLAVMRKELESSEEQGNIEKAQQLKDDIKNFDVQEVALSLVDEVIANGEHDWLQISAKFLEGKQSPESCKSFWYLYLHPKINKSPYTEDEEKRLIDLVEEHNHEDWDNIAEMLGTNRSGYQCFIVYQNKLNNGLKKNNWSPEEDRQLVKVVEKCRLGDYIPWGKVSYYMDGRTKTQVFNRWTYSLNPAIKHGRFEQDEDIMILVGVQMWGEDFQRISKFLTDRTTTQVRDRYRNYLNRPGMGLPWTVDDDELLLKLEKKHGKAWVKIAEHFPTKDRTQVRHRHNTLISWRQRHPDAPLSDAPARVYNPVHYKEFQKQWEKAKSILKCGSLAEIVTAKNNLVSTLKKTKKLSQEVKKKKPTLIESDLVNYFRCSYEIPGGRKFFVRTSETPKAADELAMLVRLLKAKLNLPTSEELLEDSTTTTIEKDLLTAYMEKDIAPEVGSEDWDPSDQDINQLFSEERETCQTPIFCDVNSSSEKSATTNIDYVPLRDPELVYTQLPLMNFEEDEIAVDRNRATFCERPILEYLDSNPSLKIADPSTSRNKEEYMLPPNFSTLIGLRTLLLNRRNLVEWSNEKKRNAKNCNLVGTNRVLEETRKKFDERFRCLFFWPALMSRHGPAPLDSIFFDEKDKCGSSKKKSSDIEMQTSSSPVCDIVEPEVEECPGTSSPPKKRKACLRPTTGRPSLKGSEGPRYAGPPKKRLKNMNVEDPSKDLNDPEAI